MSPRGNGVAVSDDLKMGGGAKRSLDRIREA
jgi:hypothetical protein